MVMSDSLAVAIPFAESEAGSAALVRERTKLVHRAAERSGFIADLLHGRATQAGYALFLRNLHPAYAALETALSTLADHPLAGAFADPRLHRLDALSADLRATAGAKWENLPLLPEATTYAEAITAVASDPGRLAGHAYARYLGDLSGGQILKPLLVRMLGLGPEALGFYEFPAYTDLAKPRLALRNALDAVPAASQVAQALCDEAVTAFGHNIAVAEAVQAFLVRP